MINCSKADFVLSGTPCATFQVIMVSFEYDHFLFMLHAVMRDCPHCYDYNSLCGTCGPLILRNFLLFLSASAFLLAILWDSLSVLPRSLFQTATVKLCIFNDALLVYFLATTPLEHRNCSSVCTTIVVTTMLYRVTSTAFCDSSVFCSSFHAYARVTAPLLFYWL